MRALRFSSRLAWVVVVGSASCSLAFPLDELTIGSGGTTATDDTGASTGANASSVASASGTTVASTVDAASSTSATGSGGASGCAPGRTEADRPDDVGGYQVHVNYVLPSDGVDDALDTNGSIATSIAAVQAWVSGQMGDGRSLRFDTCGGELDVRFLRIDATDADMRDKGVFIRDALEGELVQLGAIHPQKLEVVYYGGDAAESCGSAPRPPALVGRVAGIYLKGTYADPMIPGCATNPVGLNPQQMNYIEMVVMHETLHALGYLAACAPHVDANAHATDDALDIMWAGSFSGQNVQLDVNHDDYFEHGTAGCPDLARSSFVEPLPQDAEPPPGW